MRSRWWPWTTTATNGALTGNLGTRSNEVSEEAGKCTYNVWE